MKEMTKERTSKTKNNELKEEYRKEKSIKNKETGMKKLNRIDTLTRKMKWLMQKKRINQSMKQERISKIKFNKEREKEWKYFNDEKKEREQCIRPNERKLEEKKMKKKAIQKNWKEWKVRIISSLLNAIFQDINFNDLMH